MQLDTTGGKHFTRVMWMFFRSLTFSHHFPIFSRHTYRNYYCLILGITEEKQTPWGFVIFKIWRVKCYRGDGDHSLNFLFNFLWMFFRLLTLRSRALVLVSKMCLFSQHFNISQFLKRRFFYFRSKTFSSNLWSTILMNLYQSISQFISRFT